MFMLILNSPGDVPLLFPLCIWTKNAAFPLVEEVGLLFQTIWWQRHNISQLTRICTGTWSYLRIRYLTRLQMIQFVCVFFHALLPLLFDCGYPKIVPLVRHKTYLFLWICLWIWCPGDVCKCSCLLRPLCKLLLLCLRQEASRRQERSSNEEECVNAFTLLKEDATKTL